jgi:hypothetical protein
VEGERKSKRKANEKMNWWWWVFESKGEGEGEKGESRQSRRKEGRKERRKRKTHEIDEAIDKCLDAKLEWSPAVHLLVALGALGGVRLVDQVAHSILGLGCSPQRPHTQQTRTRGMDRSEYNMAKKSKGRDPNQFRLEPV